MLIVQGLNGLNGASDVLALNDALIKLGYKDVFFTSIVSDQTAAALWDAVKGNLAKVQSVAAKLSKLPGTSSASTAIGWLVETMKWIDKSLGDILPRLHPRRHHQRALRARALGRSQRCHGWILRSSEFVAYQE